MTALAQKHKEFSRLACACSNFLFFQGQRNRWIPHRVLLQMGGVCSSSTYKSTAPPVVSTLSELLSKQLISVLGAAADGSRSRTGQGTAPVRRRVGSVLYTGIARVTPHKVRNSLPLGQVTPRHARSNGGHFSRGICTTCSIVTLLRSVGSDRRVWVGKCHLTPS